MVTDAREVDSFKENLYVTAEGGIRFYAGAPLTTHDRHHIGTACVVDTVPRSFSEDQKVLLGLFARMVMHEIEQRQISQRQAALQEALDKAQMQLTTALKAGKVTTWHWDFASNLISGAADLAQLFHQDRNEISSGINSESLLTVVHPDDHHTIINSIQNALDTGQDYEAEYRIVSSTGQDRWVAARGQIHYEQDEPTTTDIQERKMAHQELESHVAARTRELLDANTHLLHLNAELE